MKNFGPRVRKVNSNQHNSAKENQLVSFLLEEQRELNLGYLETNSGYLVHATACGMNEISIEVISNQLLM